VNTSAAVVEPRISRLQTLAGTAIIFIVPFFIPFAPWCEEGFSIANEREQFHETQFIKVAWFNATPSAPRSEIHE